MTDVGTETAFRLDQGKHFRKSKHLLTSEVNWCDLHLRRSTCRLLVSRSIKMVSVTDLSQKESFPGSEFKPASVWTCWMQIDRQMQSVPFMPELHRWISKLTARHLQGPPGDLLINMVKETVICIKRVSKNEKKSYLSLIWKRWKRENDCEIACNCVRRANVVLHVELCKEIFDRRHTGTHKPTSAQPTHCATMTHTHTHTHTPHTHTHTHTHTYTHTHIHTYTYKIAGRCGAPRPPMTDVGLRTETAFRLDQRKHFRKSKHLLRSEVSWCDLHLRRSTCTSE